MLVRVCGTKTENLVLKSCPLRHADYSDVYVMIFFIKRLGQKVPRNQIEGYFLVDRELTSHELRETICNDEIY